MADHSTIETVQAGEDYYHVRYRDPDTFDEIRTPDWADEASDSVVTGCEVRTGRVRGSDDWAVQSVLVPIDAVDSDDGARRAADDVVRKIES